MCIRDRAATWHEFTQGRAECSFEQIHWEEQAQRLHISLSSTVDGLTLLLPVQMKLLNLVELQVNRKEIPIAVRRVGATLYSVAVLEPGASLIQARYGSG